MLEGVLYDGYDDKIDHFYLDENKIKEQFIMNAEKYRQSLENL